MYWSNCLFLMAQTEVEDLVVHLEESLELSNMEQGVKLIGAVLVDKTLNRWIVRNVLRSAWKEFGEIPITWVKDNTFITVRDEEIAARILNQVPWAVMKQIFSVKMWAQELALEEIPLRLVSFWVQIRGAPLYLTTEENARRMARAIGELMVENL